MLEKGSEVEMPRRGVPVDECEGGEGESGGEG